MKRIAIISIMCLTAITGWAQDEIPYRIIDTTMVFAKEDFYISTDHYGLSRIYASDDLGSSSFVFFRRVEPAHITWWKPEFSMKGDEIITSVEDISCEFSDEVFFASGYDIAINTPRKSLETDAPIKDYYVYYRNDTDLSTCDSDFFKGVHDFVLWVSPFRYDSQSKTVYLRTKIHIQIRLHERPKNKYTEKGVVTDQDGKPVPNALVTLLDTITARTDSNGNYEISFETRKNEIIGPFLATAEGYTTVYSNVIPYFSDNKNEYSYSREITLYNGLNLKAGQKQTIILPVTPDTSYGRYYRFQNYRDKQIIFEREFEPKAFVPYILVPNHDARLDLSGMDLSQDSIFSVVHDAFGTCSFEGAFVTRSTTILRSEARYLIDSDLPNVTGGRIEAMHAALIYPRDWGSSVRLVLIDPEGEFRPFIEEGKRWKVGHYRVSETEPYNYSEYYFDGDTVIAGRACKRWMELFYGPEGGEETITELGALYEEDRKVWRFLPHTTKPQLLYDFAAEEGDELILNGTNGVNVTDVRWISYHGKPFHCITLQNKAQGTDGFGPSKNVWINGIGNCNSPLDNYYVDKAGTNYQLLSCTVGDKVIYDNADNPLVCLADYRDDIYYRPIIEEGKQWEVGIWGNEQYEYRKIYSIGSPERTLNLISYGLVCSTQARGEKYPKHTFVGYLYERDRKVWFLPIDQDNPRLVYDFSARSGDTITIEGITENYVKGQSLTTTIQYCGSEANDPHHTRPLKTYRLSTSDKGEEWIAGIGGVPSPVWNYGLANDGLKERLISCQVGSDTLYYDPREAARMASSIEKPEFFSRPFIEEGKVWKMGWRPSTLTYTEVKRLNYYCFEGDTIIDGKVCKKMLCRHEASPEYPFEHGTEPWTEYIAALYEEGRHLYGALPGDDKLYTLYDFDAAVGDTIQFRSGVASNTEKFISGVVIRKYPSFNYIFKGNTVTLRINQTDNFNYCTWWEGVGYDYMPLNNINEALDEQYNMISCIVGDELLHYDTFMRIDPSLIEDTDIKKQQLDFTHVVKPRPKAPRQGVNEANEEKALTGEYSLKELFVNFKPLAGPYAITICDANGKEVYRKEVQTSNVVGLNTDISGYGKGEYTITVENDAEEYTATFSIGNEDGIRIPTPDLSREEKADAVYDLSGRQIANSKLPISKLPRGIYISGGKKVVVK